MDMKDNAFTQKIPKTSGWGFGVLGHGGYQYRVFIEGKRIVHYTRHIQGTPSGEGTFWFQHWAVGRDAVHHTCVHAWTEVGLPQ